MNIQAYCIHFSEPPRPTTGYKLGWVGRKGESLGKQMVERDKKKTWEANAHIEEKKRKFQKKKKNIGKHVEIIKEKTRAGPSVSPMYTASGL